MTQDVTYIHYGNDFFHTPDPICNRDWFTKPRGGLWASRTDGEHDWRSWCETEEFRLENLDYHFTFRLKDNARVLELNHEDQLDDLPKLQKWDKSNQYSECLLDFEKLAKDYDAIEVTNIWRFYWPLYGWDCNSILIMNPDIVEVIDECKNVEMR